MSVTTTSMGDVIDALLAMWRALDECAAPVEVFDGFPGPNIPDVFVQIGGTIDPTAEGTQEWASLGSQVAPTRDETYAISCYVTAFVGGADAATAGAGNAQKRARDQALTIVQALETSVRNDPKLETAYGDGIGLGTGWIAFGGGIRLDETSLESGEAGKGRSATFSFQIQVFKRLYS